VEGELRNHEAAEVIRKSVGGVEQNIRVMADEGDEDDQGK